MYTTSQAYKKAILKNTREFDTRITMGDKVIHDEAVISFKITGGIQSSDYFMIGATVSQRLDIIFLNEKLTVLSDNVPIKVEIGLVLESGAVEYIPVGLFNIDDITANDMTTSVVCFDNMLKLEVAHGAQGAETVEGILEKITRQTGVRFESPRAEIANTSLEFNITQEEGLNCRTILSYICSYFFANAVIDRHGKIKIIEYKPFNPDVTLGMSDYKEYKNTNVEYILGKIECQINRETILEYGEESDTTKKLQFKNPAMTQERLVYGYNLLREHRYVGFTVDFAGDPSIDTGDIIQLNKKSRSGQIAPILSQEYNYNGGLSFKLKSSGDGKNDNLNAFKPFDNKLREFDRKDKDLRPRVDRERDRLSAEATVFRIYLDNPSSSPVSLDFRATSSDEGTLPLTGTVYIDWGDGSDITKHVFSSEDRYAEEHYYKYGSASNAVLQIYGSCKIPFLFVSVPDNVLDIVRFGQKGYDGFVVQTGEGVKNIEEDVPIDTIRGLKKRNIRIQGISTSSSFSEELTLPPSLFSRLTDQESFYATFYGCVNLVSIPPGLFDNNPKATSFNYTFYGCVNLDSMPPDLFNGVLISNASSCFERSFKKGTEIEKIELNCADDANLYNFMVDAGVSRIGDLIIVVFGNGIRVEDILGNGGSFPSFIDRIDRIVIHPIFSNPDAFFYFKIFTLWSSTINSIGDIIIGDNVLFNMNVRIMQLKSMGNITLGDLSRADFSGGGTSLPTALRSVGNITLGKGAITRQMFSQCRNLEFVGTIHITSFSKGSTRNPGEFRYDSTYEMFRGCEKLKSVTVIGGSPLEETSDGYITYMPLNDTFVGCDAMATVNVQYCSIDEKYFSFPNDVKFNCVKIMRYIQYFWGKEGYDDPLTSLTSLPLKKYTKKPPRIFYLTRAWRQSEIDYLNRLGWVVYHDGRPHINNWKNVPEPR